MKRSAISPLSSICFHHAQVHTGFSTLKNGAVLIENGKIQEVFSEKRFLQKTFSHTQLYDCQEMHIAPGFIDTHIHGSFGYGTEDAKKESMLELSRRLPELGVTSFLPTLYPQEEKLFEEMLRENSAALGEEEGAHILGLHLEGPFVSPEKPGALPQSALRKPDIELLKHYLDLARKRVTTMTVAPELKNMRELSLYALSENVTLQAGHSVATYEQALEGFEAGIIHSTHFFNAMSTLHHRNPNLSGAILLHPHISCEIIADGFHVHPLLITLIAQAKPLDKIVLVTDALKPTFQEKGPFFANREEVEFDGKLFVKKKDGVIAGSALTMIKGVENLVSYGFSLNTALHMASANPAQVFRFSNKGTLLPGKDADLVIFDEKFSIQATLILGKMVYNQFF